MKKQFTILLFLVSLIGTLVFAQPSNVTPTTGSSVILSGGNVNLSWTAGGGPIYTLNYSINAVPQTPISPVTSPYTLSGLVAGDVVSWTITDGTAATSTSTTFTVITSPTPSPLNAATGISQGLVSLSWTAFDEAGFGNGNYDVEFGTDNTFGVILTSSNNTALTNLTLPALSFNTTYYWRVRDTDIDGIGGNGTWFVFSFTTISGSPIISSPLNNAISVAINTTVSWGAISGANMYQLEINDDNTFTNATEYTENINALTSSSASGLINNTTYYARVRSSNNGGTNWSSWSSTSSFTTVLATAGLTAPVNAATGQPLSVNLTWSLSASTSNVQFNVQYSSVSNVGPWTTVTNQTSPYSLTGLSYNTQYWWRIVSTVQAGPPNATESTTSSVWSFTTIAGPPTLVSPSNNSKGISVTPTLSWNSVAGANLYRITMTGLGAPAPFTTASTSAVLPALTAGVVYTWFVEASNNAGATWGPASTTWNFTTEYLLTPANLSVGLSIVPTFDWLDVPSAASYTLEIATDNAFSSIVLSQVVSPSTYSLLPSQALVNGATYYWRVTSNTGVVSGTWSFIVVQPAMPYLTNPTSGSTIVGNVIYFSWYVVGLGASNFVLEIDDANDFLTPIQTFTGLTSGFYNWTYTGLTPGSTYYWRITAKTLGGVIVNYSSTASFVAPGMPDTYPSYPIGGLTVYTTNPYLYWYTGTFYNGQFQIRYGTSSGVYGAPLVTSNLYYALSGLTAGSTIYWQVRSWNGVIGGNWSAEQNFNVYSATATPIVPFLSYPIGGATTYTNPPTLYWYIGAYAPGLQYQVRYATNSSIDGGGMLNDISAANFGSLTTNLYATFGSSLSSGTYYWQVRSYNGVTYSNWSSVESFVIPSSSSTISTPIPTSPIGGSTIYVLNPTLSYYAYSSSALEYRINYSAWPNTDVNGVLNVANTNTLWTGSTNYVLSGLTPGVTYYWQVQARLTATPATMSSWSSLASFTTAAGAFAVVPQIGSPNYGQPINNNTAVLSWVIPTQSSSPLKYDLQYSDKADMSNSKTVSNLSNPFYQVSGLNKNSTYYWRVSSKNETGKSDYSSLGSFKTVGTTSVEGEILPTEFSLEQNYPNPFNPTTIINYSIPTNSYVTLKVFDMLGREVKTLVNSQVVAGRHSVEWKSDNNSGNKVATGVYVYRITASNFVSTKKMLLIK